MPDVPVALLNPGFEIVSWSWGGFAPAPVKAATAGAVVQKIVELEGTVTPSQLVAASTPADAKLHDSFEWDDSVAGVLHRERQAANILNHLYVRYKEIDSEQRYVVKIQNDGQKPESDIVERAIRPHIYVTSKAVAEDSDLSRHFLVQRYRELAAFRRRNANIQEFHDIFVAIDAAAHLLDRAI